ncbi:site-specific integrase [Aliivibrio finisterrensis]|nr:site-specific integrase [Aliivibrio finisterrensis]
MNDEAYREMLNNWWNSLTNEQKKSAPITHNSIDFRFLFNSTKTLYHEVRRYLKEDISKIDEELKILGVLLNKKAYKKRLNNWWDSLTDVQKKSVPTTRNSVDLRHLFNDARLNYNSIRHYYLWEDINKIEEELKQLGTLLNDDDKVIETLMCDFISDCESNPDQLWDVELTTRVYNRKLIAEGRDHYFEQYGLISAAYLANKFNCKPYRCSKPVMLELRKQLNQLLLKYEVSLPYRKIKDSSHAIGSDMNHRRIFLKWKNGLTDEEKLELPMFGKVIDKIALSHLVSIERLQTIGPLLAFEFKRFSSEVLILKGTDYKTFKERKDLRKEKALGKEESPRSAFYKLRHKKLVSIEDFSSEKGWYEDVRHVFAVASLKASSKSGIANYYIGYTHYCDFLETKEVFSDSSFKECFDSWSLRDFKEFLGEKIGEKTLSTAHANTILSSLRITLNRLKTFRNISFNYLPTDGFEVIRETLAYKPYTLNERKQIHEMLEREMTRVKKKLEPYKKLDRKNVNLDDSKIQARIIFEDDCNCIPPYWNSEDRNRNYTKGQRKLCSFAATRRLSLAELLEEWGVLTRRVLTGDIGVYVLKMAQVLGMNLSPILELDIDDYQEHHPLTNKPCLTYWKERSTGEKMIHLDLFHAELQWLTMSQQKFVETVFDEVIQLTSEARKYMPDDISNRLFVTFQKAPKALAEMDMSKLYSDLVEKYQLKDNDGEPLLLRTTRFRPTLVSELVDAGISIREIQYLLGHTSIYTTMKYLDQLEFDRVIKEKAKKAIEDIYSSTIQVSDHDSSKKQQRRYDENLIIMKTPLGGCKNIFDPPEFIKKSSLYVKGKPCSQYNKCLSCEYVMLTKIHLPELFAMQRDYLGSLESGAVVNTPYYAVVLENISLLDDILNPETSEFDEDTLMEAKENSLFIETTILDSWSC